MNNEEIKRAFFIALNRQFKDLAKEAESLRNKYLRIHTEVRTKIASHPTQRKILHPYEQRIIALTEQFNSAVREFFQLIETEHKDLKALSLTSSIKNLDKIQIQSNKLSTIIEHIMIPLSPIIIDKLDSLKKEIDRVINSSDIKDNFNISIKEFEESHLLASCLITSRVIDQVFNKLPSINKDSKDAAITQNKVKYLIEHGIIDKKDKDVQEKLIKANQKARNFLNHKLNIDQEPSDAISLLGDAVTLVKIYEKLNLEESSQ